MAGPQSLSVTRITAFEATDMPQLLPHPVSVKSKTTLSPWSKEFAKPPDAVSEALVEVGATESEVPGIFTGT